MYFTTSLIPRTTSYVTYQLENFIFDIGGLLGLFLGSSLVSLFQIPMNVYRFFRRQRFHRRISEVQAPSVEDINIEIPEIYQTQSKTFESFYRERQGSTFSGISQNIYILTQEKVLHSPFYRD